MTDGYLAHSLAPTGSVTVGENTIRFEQTMQFVLGGELDLCNAAALQDELRRALDDRVRRRGKPTRLLLDLRDLTFIDSAGIHALVAAKRRCDRRGVGFAIRLGDSHVRRVLTLAGFAEFLGLE